MGIKDWFLLRTGSQQFDALELLVAMPYWLHLNLHYHQLVSGHVSEE